MDVLADIVGALDLRSSLYFRARFSAPFAVAVPEDRRRIRFHVAGPGRSWIGLPSGEQASYADGDLVLVPHGRAHTLASGPGETPRDLDAVLAAEPPREGLLCHGGGGEPALLVCGHFAFDESALHPLVEALPPLLHVPAGDAGFAWMPPLLETVEKERARAAPASDAVARRLSEILLIQVLRAALAQGESRGLLGALADPQLGRALEAIHEDLAAPWSLGRLAGVAGLSRSLFADRFRACVGTTPMRYVADWRMSRARAHLADGSLSVGEVGRRVGYASEAAFSRVFRERVGEAPGRYRRGLELRSA